MMPMIKLARLLALSLLLFVPCIAEQQWSMVVFVGRPDDSTGRYVRLAIGMESQGRCPVQITTSERSSSTVYVDSSLLQRLQNANFSNEEPNGLVPVLTVTVGSVSEDRWLTPSNLSEWNRILANSTVSKELKKLILEDRYSPTWMRETFAQ